MSFVDLATLTMHRRHELESRLNMFHEKCDRAIEDLKKYKKKTQGFVLQLNCDPSELKDRFLTCMKQLDEYMYLITDFNLAISKLEEVDSIENTPVHDTGKAIHQSPGPFNLIDALSEPTPTTSTACSNLCSPDKPERVKPSKKAQPLIVFSSTSSSEETVKQSKTNLSVREVPCELANELSTVKIEEAPSLLSPQTNNLPRQKLLDTDQLYEATIMHVDGIYFWVITDNPEEVERLIIEMTKHYRQKHKPLSMRDIMKLTICAFYDEDGDCYYRGLFLKINEEDSKMAEVFTVDTGELRRCPVDCLQVLHERFFEKPPYARCCFLAGVDMSNCGDESLMEKQEAFMKEYVGRTFTIEVDENTSEILGVFVMLPSGDTLNSLAIERKIALPIDKAPSPKPHEVVAPPPPGDSEHDSTEYPEYDDPVEAVTGYSNRDEAEICKHYKGGPEKTCFKGKKCTKKHIVMHPDGWTLDRQEVMAKCKSIPLPKPGTWHKVLVTFVCHYDRVYVQLLDDKNTYNAEAPSRFGVMMPPTTLQALVNDMNSPATRFTYKPLTIPPALGELVVALYPPDGNWYRARVMSITRADQSVEVRYVDYGTVLWVHEDQLRVLAPRYSALPVQALRVQLAGVRARSADSQQWASAKRALHDMVMNKKLDAHVIGRDYDEVTVELYDADGYSVAEQLAAINMVDLVDYAVVDDSDITQKIIAP